MDGDKGYRRGRTHVGGMAQKRNGVENKDGERARLVHKDSDGNKTALNNRSSVTREGGRDGGR